MELFRLMAKIGLDTSEYERGIGKTQSSFKKFGSTISAQTVAMGNLIASGIEKAVSAVGRLGSSAITAAADIAAENAQFTAAFGELEAAATGTFNSIAKDTGVLSTRLRNVGTKAFSQFKGAGLDAVSALSSMDTYTRLAADAAAYYDMSLEDADERLRSFLRGNTEAGDSIGLFTSETQRNNKALEVYGQKWLDLTEAQKQMLMLDIANEIYEQSGAIGQAQREADGWSNVVGNLKEAWRQALGVIGTPFVEGLTPAIQKLTEFLSEDTVIMRLGILASDLGSIAGTTFDGVINFLDKLIGLSSGEEELHFNIEIPTWDEIRETAEAALKTIIDGIESFATWTLGTFSINGIEAEEIVAQFSEWWKNNTMYDKIRQVAGWALGKMGVPTTADEAVEAFTSFWNGLALPAIEGVAKWALGEMILPFLFGEGGIITKFENWWNNTVAPDVKEKTGWDVQLPELPTIDEMVDAISNWWANVKKAVGNMLSLSANVNVFNSARNFKSEGQGVTEGGAVWGDYNADVPSLLNQAMAGKATGLDYVPYDNFAARLHFGEAVLNRADASAWRAGTGAQIDAGTLAAAVGEAVRAALEGMNVNIDGQRAGSLLAEPVSRSIAQMARNRRYQMG